MVPRPRWFLSRGKGTFVPLIPADELPPGIHLVGAPREMTIASAVGMEFVGEFPLPQRHYVLETNKPGQLSDSNVDSSPPSPTLGAENETGVQSRRRNSLSQNLDLQATSRADIAESPQSAPWRHQTSTQSPSNQGAQVCLKALEFDVY